MRSTNSNPVSGARCFRKDLPRIKILAQILENNEEAHFRQEHIISRALAALEEKVSPDRVKAGKPA